MSIFLDHSILVELFTLTILEIVLGIDNLLFIAILVDKLPAKQKDKVRIIGLLIALLIRIITLSFISWIVSLTNPFFKIFNFVFSGRKLILIFGGIFLIFKASVELHDRLEHHVSKNKKNENNNINFWNVIIQIVLLDLVFSLDAVITAVGMVNNIFIMITSVILAMFIMLMSSKILTKFINSHPTLIILCLSFLLMLGIILVSEGLGYHIDKSYLYTSIGFSILIELLNQIGRRNFIKNQSHKNIRERVAEAILKLLGGKYHNLKKYEKIHHSINNMPSYKKEFKDKERYMINEVLNLACRSVKSIMTPRERISWINTENSIKSIKYQLLNSPYSFFPVCKKKLDNIIGIATAKEILCSIDKKSDILNLDLINKPTFVLESINTINLLEVLRKSKNGFLLVVSKKFKNYIKGIITPIDFLEAITGNFTQKNK